MGGGLIFAGHSGSCCIIILSLAAKAYTVQMISSGKTFNEVVNFCCDPDLNTAKQSFYKALRFMMLYHQSKIV